MTDSCCRRATVLGGLVLLAACADTRATSTGFLAEADQVRAPEGRPDADRTYVRPAEGPPDWRGFLVEEVVWRPAPSAPTDLPDADVAEVVAGFRAELIAAFSERLPAQPAAAPGILRIRAAVTDIRRARPVLNAISMLAIHVPVSSGGASSESEVLDGGSGRRVAALAGYNNGGRSFLGGPFGFMSRHGHARRALRVQARRLRDITLGDRA